MDESRPGVAAERLSHPPHDRFRPSAALRFAGLSSIATVVGSLGARRCRNATRA